MRAGITGAFRVPGESDDGRRVVEFCAKRGLYVGDTYFKHISLHKYKRVEKVQDEVEVKSMIDLVLVYIKLQPSPATACRPCDGGRGLKFNINIYIY